ncbi:AcrR family transcriptional regulator [Paenibacillus turicensis]|uniref:AcrR family transcriptional regulator n=1 Tax=Paenibacillus turicensis TaxID=160487 RepID=A0ABS4FWE8_9BACL|nr:TetR/AcrR family transcriptional regulator [Paenibacillus turicensis]MBP1906916.1 AcrR family transcriptional regulator [Paenibacillus turicensis]
MTESWHQGVKNKHRQQYIDAGKAFFASHGLMNVSIKDICEHAGVSRVTFYKHFESIHELIFEVQIVLLQDMFQFISTTGAQKIEPNGLQKLKTLLEAWLHYAEEHPSHIRLILMFDLHYGQNSQNEVSQELEQYFRDFIDMQKNENFLIKPIEQGIRDGSIQAGIEARTSALFIFTSMMGLLSRLSLFPVDDQNNDMGQQFIDMLIKHISCHE